jgi:hypothetical protein
MAVIDIQNANLTFGKVPLGIQVTKVTDTSADWPSVANNTYFYDKGDGLLHYKDSGGTVLELFSAGGLTYFTEAQNTAAPNATVPVDSLTAVSATTNADFGVIPKGSGAIVAQIPDNTTTGGNKRGQYAVDFTRTRDNAVRVASGNYSFAIGENCTASGIGSFAFGTGYSTASGTNSLAGCGGFAAATNSSAIALGYGTNATGSNCVAIGLGNTASGGLAIGVGNTASGTEATALGRSSISSGFYSFAFGHACVSNSTVGLALGSQSHTHGVRGRLAFSSGQEGTTGDSQMSIFILRNRTTDTTATILTLDSNTTVTGDNMIYLSNNSAYGFTGTIVGKQSGSTNACMWKVTGLIARGANAASTTLTFSSVDLVSNAPGWGTPTLAADTTNGGLQVQVVGLAATNIQWTATIETTEVIYA